MAAAAASSASAAAAAESSEQNIAVDLMRAVKLHFRERGAAEGDEYKSFKQGLKAALHTLKQCAATATADGGEGRVVGEARTALLQIQQLFEPPPLASLAHQLKPLLPPVFASEWANLLARR